MTDRVSDSPSDFEAPKTQVSRQADASARAFVRPKETSIGMHAVVIKESEHLGPQAYNADGAGMRAMEAQKHAFLWSAERPSGSLEGNVSKKTPEKTYILWFFKYGEFWMKIITADWEAMQEEIRTSRAEMKSKMYKQTIEHNFRDLIEEISQKRAEKSKKLSVLTYASDDFLGGSSKKKTTEEASPGDINPKEEKPS